MEPNNQSSNQQQSLVPSDMNHPYWRADHADHAAAVEAVRSQFKEKYDGEGAQPNRPVTVDVNGKPVELDDMSMRTLRMVQAAGNPAAPAGYSLEEPAMAPVGVTLG